MLPGLSRTCRVHPLTGWRAATLTLGVTLFAQSPEALIGQTGTPSIVENFRTGPNGAILAEVIPGAVLAVKSDQGAWVEAELEGWVWAQSLQVTDRNGFDLVVASSQGENLRARPQGRRLARLRTGTLLRELDRRPGWIQVRRVGWIWKASLILTPEPDDAAPTEPLGPEDDVGGGDEPVTAVEEPAPPTEAIRVLPSGLVILTGPGGERLGSVERGTAVEIVARDGNWARVRIEGWSWLPVGADVTADSAEASVPVSIADVMDDPERFRGRMVTWSLQYISLEYAENVRTDLLEGEAFLLTRPGTSGGRFVYVTVSEDQLQEVRGLAPLERIEVVGRIREGASRSREAPSSSSPSSAAAIDADPLSGSWRERPGSGPPCSVR